MPPLTDPELLRRYRVAFSNWQTTGNVEVIGLADAWLRAQMPNLTRDGFLQFLSEQVTVHGMVPDQQPEMREGWRDKWECHYDLRPVLNGARIYVETRLHPESFADRDDPVVYIVNVHLA